MSAMALQKVEWVDQNLTYLPRWRQQNIDHGFAWAAMAPHYFHVKQTHSCHIVPIDQASQSGGKEAIEADGLWTQSRDQIIAVKTADCVPLLLVGQAAVMAIHGGWRGLAGGILVNGLTTMKELGETPQLIRLGIGPCISGRRFEVGPEVVETFKHSEALSPLAFALCIRKGDRGKWHIDLATFAVLQAIAWGIDPTNCDVLLSCTYDHPDHWPSYRRSGSYQKSIISWVGRGQQGE